MAEFRGDAILHLLQIQIIAVGTCKGKINTPKHSLFALNIQAAKRKRVLVVREF